MSKSLKYKWLECRCEGCNCLLPQIRGEAGTQEPILSVCHDCLHPEIKQREEAEWDAVGMEVMKMAARGELLDADGDPVPPITVIQHGDGTYTTRRFALDLFGELVEVSAAYEQMELMIAGLTLTELEQAC